MGDDELARRGRVLYAGGPIGPVTLAEIRRAERRYRDDVLASDWPAF